MEPYAVRKARQKRGATHTTEHNARSVLEARIGRRICMAVYGGVDSKNFNAACVCDRRGGDTVCDNMKLAAQHAIQEIVDA